MSSRRAFVCVVLGVLGAGCGSAGSNNQTGTGGAAAPGTGGSSARGGSVGTGGSPATGGAIGAGGSAASGSGGVSATGGTNATGGTRGTGGVAGGGGATGSAGRMGTGGTSSGGSAGSINSRTGNGGAGGMPGVGGSSGKAPPVPSAGCGTQGLASLIASGQSVSGGLPTSTRLKITSGGTQREYIIDIPSNYDANHPYRLFFAFHWIGSTDTAVATGQVTNGGATNWGYYGLHREATSANDPAIFVAPQSVGSTWNFAPDSTYFMDMYTLFTSKLCVDTSRVFATGFSFGAMMTYALSITHQQQLRAVVAIAAANFNLPGEPTDTNSAPIAYMGTVGMSDTTCPYVNSDANKTGGKYCALTHAMDNGCTIPTTIPTTTAGSKTHVCYDFQGCKPGYPVKMCTFDGVHQAAPLDGASGDNGLTSWIPTASWQFFTQF